jgi:hypothetical protein
MQKAYNRLVDAGVPLEDARNLLPLGIQHRMTWSTNLSALMHILSKRGCWIAQMGMWEPVILGIVKELSEKVDPFFHELVTPPCISNDKFSECKFHKENDEYIKGTDPHYPCPLWLYNHWQRAQSVSLNADNPTWVPKPMSGLIQDKDGGWWEPIRPHVCQNVSDEQIEFSVRKAKYEELWGRDPRTGERKRLA